MAKKSSKPAQESAQQLGTRIPEALYKRLQHYTIDHGLKLKDAVTEAIEEYLKKRDA